MCTYVQLCEVKALDSRSLCYRLTFWYGSEWHYAGTVALCQYTCWTGSTQSEPLRLLSDSTCYLYSTAPWLSRCQRASYGHSRLF